MILVQTIPLWFVIASIFMELFITLTALAIAFYSFKIYSLFKRKEIKIFGIAFILIAFSYIIWSSINLFFISQFSSGRILFENPLNSFLWRFILYVYYLTFITGFVTLTYTTFKIKGRRAYTLFVVLSALGIILSYNKVLAFFVISSTLLVFLLFHYVRECMRAWNPRIFMNFFAFLLLLISRVELVFTSGNYFYYILGHIIEFLAYLLLLINLLLILKNGQKKK